nr:probable WRKY transcription factor 17 [Tanacetum cinerariifolium]
MAVDLVGIQTIEHLNRIFQNHDFGGSSTFRQAVSALKRSGHARFRPSVHGSRTTGCHCCKRRKTESKRKVKMIPIIGSKVDSIPADYYSWKKYGEKKVTGTQFPRVYYKCNSVKGCPARKRVELSLTDSKMLVVTYDGEHQHPHRQPTPLPVSMTGLRIDSK